MVCANCFDDAHLPVSDPDVSSMHLSAWLLLYSVFIPNQVQILRLVRVCALYSPHPIQNIVAKRGEGPIWPRTFTAAHLTALLKQAKSTKLNKDGSKGFVVDAAFQLCAAWTWV